MKKIFNTLVICLSILTCISCIFVFGNNIVKDDKEPEKEPVEVNYGELTYIAWGDSITYGVDGVNGGK